MSVRLALLSAFCLLSVTADQPTGYVFPTYDFPKYLDIGHDSAHVRIKERYGLLQAAIRDVQNAYADGSGFTVVEWGSEYGALCLSVAEDFPDAKIFSLDADYQARPLPEHLAWYTVPEHAEHIGMIAYQLEVAKQAGFSNFDACEMFVTETTFAKLREAGLKLHVQFGVQFFHWLMDYLPDRAHFERVLADFVSIAHVTLVDIPPKGTSVPDTGPWFETGDNVTQIVIDALKKYKLSVSVEQLSDGNLAQNPFLLFRITNFDVSPQTPAESLGVLAAELTCVQAARVPAEGYCTDDGSAGVSCNEPGREAFTLFDGTKRLSPEGAPIGIEVFEEFESEEGQLFYFNTRTRLTQWHTSRHPHYVYRRKKFVYTLGESELR